MVISNNINFESYVPVNKFKDKKNFNKKIIDALIKKTKKEVEEEKCFLFFSKNFKLNLNSVDLKKYKKFQRIIIMGWEGRY